MKAHRLLCHHPFPVNNPARRERPTTPHPPSGHPRRVSTFQFIVKSSRFYRKYRSHTAHFERDFLGGFGRMVKGNKRVYPPGRRKTWRKRDTQQIPARALTRGIDSTNIEKRRLSIRLYQNTWKGWSIFFAPLAIPFPFVGINGDVGSMSNVPLWSTDGLGCGNLRTS
jgi:hypothetical protein